MTVFERDSCLLRPPCLRTLEQGDGGRASYLELYFGLVFTGLAALVLAALVVFKLWTTQRPLRPSVA